MGLIWTPWKSRGGQVGLLRAAVNIQELTIFFWSFDGGSGCLSRLQDLVTSLRMSSLSASASPE